MRTCTIFDSHLYTIESHDNGGAYTIIRKSNNESVFIPYGDDANAFRWDFDNSQKFGNWKYTGNGVCADYINLYG